ncbi:MAG: hypothetical protein JWQ80_2983 [Massilia sp.]|nr:hypothetical protein [Massilia sp.]
MSRPATSPNMMAAHTASASDSTGIENWTRVETNDMIFYYGMLLLGTLVHCNI